VKKIRLVGQVFYIKRDKTQFRSEESNVKKIGKISIVVLTVLFAGLAFMSTIKPARATIGGSLYWSGYTFLGTDSFYGTASIVAYVNGSTVKLLIPVTSSPHSYVNVTSINIIFETGLNKTFNYSPVVKIISGETKYFEVSFTANQNELSNLVAHTYTVYVNFIKPDATTDKFTKDWDDFNPDYKFVVYSGDQKDIKELAAKCSVYSNLYSYVYTTQARVLAFQANAEVSQASILLNRGDFAGAKTHYGAAVTLYEQALDYEGEKGTQQQDAEMNAMLTEADAAMISAQALANQAYGYILFGLGWILIGIGVIIYGSKKPKAS